MKLQKIYVVQRNKITTLENKKNNINESDILKNS